MGPDQSQSGFLADGAAGLVATGLFDAETFSDERILKLAVWSLARYVSVQAFSTIFVPQVGVNQGRPVRSDFRIKGLPNKIKDCVNLKLNSIDLSTSGPRTFDTEYIDGHYITAATIATEYDINIGEIVLIHREKIALRAVGVVLSVFESVTAFRKEARALSHHREFLGLDTQVRERLDREIGRIVHNAINPNQTLIFVPDQDELFRAAFISEFGNHDPVPSLHVRRGKNAISRAFAKLETSIVQKLDEDVGGEAVPVGIENYLKRNGYHSCLIAPVGGPDKCYCVIVCLFNRPNAVSIVESRIVDSMAHLLADYYRIWHRNREVELSRGEASEVLKQVRELLLIVDVLHDAAEDLVVLRGQLGMLDPKPEHERETLKNAKTILNSLITATRHLKAFYSKRNGRSFSSGGFRTVGQFRPEKVVPYNIVSELEKKYRSELIQSKIYLRNMCPYQLSFFGVEHNVKRALDNAIKNSIHHLKSKTHVKREILISAFEERHQAQASDAGAFVGRTVGIEVADNGPGIQPELLVGVRQRYVSHRGGMGLGVPIMEAACDTHGGRLDLESSWGSSFRVTLRFGEMAGRE